MRIGRLYDLDVTLALCAGAFKETGRLSKAIRQYHVERVFCIRGSKRAPVLKCHAVTKREGKSESVVRALNVGRKFGHVIELFIFLYQRIEHEDTHAFAGGVDGRRADRIDCLDVVRE